MINNLIFYDLETTGRTNDPTARITEAAVLLVTPNGITTYNELFCTDHNDEKIIVPEEITKITGISTEMLEADGIPFTSFIDYFDGLPSGNDTTIIGHNIVNFDNKFILNFLGIDINQYSYDTAGDYKGDMIKWKKFPSSSFYSFHSKVLGVMRKGLKFNLDHVAKEYSIEIPENRHRALVDVILTSKIFLVQWHTKYVSVLNINPNTINKLKQFILQNLNPKEDGNN